MLVISIGETDYEILQNIIIDYKYVPPGSEDFLIFVRLFSSKDTFNFSTQMISFVDLCHTLMNIAGSIYIYV